MVYCPRCKKHKSIKGFHRDDPVLTCGHIKHRDNKATDMVEEVERLFFEEAKERNTSIEEVKKEFIQGMLEILGDSDEPETIGYCTTCGIVTVYVDDNGRKRCGGNLIDNPGCGMPIDSQTRYGLEAVK